MNQRREADCFPTLVSFPLHTLLLQDRLSTSINMIWLEAPSLMHWFWCSY